MRLIKEFKWCRQYDIEQVEIDYDLSNKHVIIHRAKSIRKIKHMFEVIKWARQFPEYRKVFSKNALYYIWKWLRFNWNRSTGGVDYLKF